MMKLRITIIIRMIILVMVAMLTFFISCQQPVAEEAEEISTAEIILGVNAYSFSDLLSARDPRNQDQVFTLIDLLDWCATQNIKALDPTAYFFPTYPEVPSDEYLKRFKNYADSLAIAISGTGNRNNFASPDSTIRREGIERAKKIGLWQLQKLVHRYCVSLPERFRKDTKKTGKSRPNG